MTDDACPVNIRKGAPVELKFQILKVLSDSAVAINVLVPFYYNMKNKALIPQGYYCYSTLKPLKKGRFKMIGICPYWSIKKNRSKQENGYCSYLDKGDYEINREKHVILCTTFKNGKEQTSKIKCGPDNPSFMSLLWDMCKMCNVKERE